MLRIVINSIVPTYNYSNIIKRCLFQDDFYVNKYTRHMVIMSII